MTREPSILLIGINSFIGQAFLQSGMMTGISHKDPALQDNISTHDVIINCAFPPSLRDQAYDSQHDIDTKVATAIQGTDKKLVILSSRAVYGRSSEVLREDMELQPLTPYAVNKARIEDSCRDILGDHLLIVRLSNIFGFEWPAKAGRNTFMSQVLTSLKEQEKMVFDISSLSEKDFLPVEDATQIIHDLILQEATGTYNVAAGTSLTMGDITDSLKKGFGKGSTDFQSDRVDSFYMDVSKLKKTGLFLPDAAEILKEFETIGRKLAGTEGTLS